jgi:sugar (pentulose or hexulose) kinase
MQPERKGYVIGVYAHKAGGWRVNFVEDGRQKTRYRKERAMADKLAVELQMRLAGVQPIGQQPATAVEGSGLDSAAWVKVLWVLTGRAVQAPTDRDHQALLRAVSGAANAAAKFINDVDQLQRIEQLEQTMRHLQANDDPLRNADSHQKGAAVTPADILQ